MCRQREALYTVRQNEYNKYNKSCYKAMDLNDSYNVEELWEDRYGR